MNFELKRNRFKRQSSEVQRKRKRWLFLSGLFLVGVFLVIGLLIFPSKPFPPAVGPSGSISTTAKESELQTIEGGVEEKSTLFKSFITRSISLRWIDLIISKLKPYVNFRKIKGGTYRFVSDRNGELVKFIYEAGPTEIYEIDKTPQGYVAQRKKVLLETYLAKVVGEIRSSLFEAMDAAGEQDPLTLALVDTLVWEIDFYKDVKQGDRFKVVVEKIYKGNQFIQYGPIHAVEYQRREKTIRGIGYQDDFYNEKGISLRKAFVKVPLRFNRISSRFSRARKHPILGGVLPHFGVDYAAPIGTPVWSVADGTVVSCGWSGGFGKQVVLRHVNGYTTYYGHLSCFAPGIKKGTRVRQKQIIGYVGSTGLSTGPHLDYRLVKDGRFRNPLKETFPTGLPIKKWEMESFQKRRDEMMAWLEGEAPYWKKKEEGETIPY